MGVLAGPRDAARKSNSETVDPHPTASRPVQRPSYPRLGGDATERSYSWRMALPAGPAWPPALQTAAWITPSAPVMERARRRYGDVFTVRLARVGTFAFSTSPDL